MKKFGRTKMTQKTQWGYIDWKYLSDEISDRRNMNVGITTLLPGCYQEEHVHYGHEQMLYVLEGEGYYMINGERKDFRPGMLFVMESEAVHETHNTGDTPVRELLVSNPVNFNYSLSDTNDYVRYGGSETETYSKNDLEILFQVTSELKDVFDQSINMPLMILNLDHKNLFQTGQYPNICREKCDVLTKGDRCECYAREIETADLKDDMDVYRCSHGRTVITYPIRYRGLIIGTVRGGHFFSSDDGEIEEIQEWYDTPESTQIGIVKILRQVALSIERYCDFKTSIMGLQASAEMTEEMRQSLSDVKNQVTNLKIDHHFLFNTLNSMAEMALEGDPMTLYESIINLSKLFRYTMKMTAKTEKVPLEEEIAHLKTYMDLQELRYRDQLKITYNVADDCEDIAVPFNFLQPIAENAFTHGFTGYKGKKRIDIDIWRENDALNIDISNNGMIPTQAELNAARHNMKMSTGHGMSLIYDKLKMCFEDGFDMDMITDEKRIMRVRIKIEVKE